VRYRLGIFAVLLLLGLMAFSPLITQDAQADAVIPSSPAAPSTDTMVDIGIYLLSISNFDSVKGTYDLEFYVYTYWNNQVTEKPSLVILNAMKVSNETVLEEMRSGGMASWNMYRATLFTSPDQKHYPFDTIDIQVIIEDDTHDISQINFLWISEQSGVDNMFQASGWNQKGTNYSVSEHSYPWGKDYSQAKFSIVLERKSLSSAVNIMLPPLIFCFVSFLAFIISPVKDNPLPVRLSLGTGMIISAVLFHVAQSSALPPFGGIRQLDIIMMSAYAAIAISLLITVLCHVYHSRGWPDEKVKKLNRDGMFLAIATPFVSYAILYLLFV
jgi:hypothetical protein